MRKKEQDTRKKIIVAALKIFSKSGFFKTRVDDIANAVGVGKGTLYLYFKDKSSLYVSVIEEHFVTGISFLKEVQKEPITETEKLRKVSDEWLDSMIRLKSSFPMFTMENLNLSGKVLKTIKPIVFTRIKEMIDIIAQIIDRGVEKGEFQRIDAHVAALHFLNTIRTEFFVKFFIPEISVDKNVSLNLFFEGLKKRR
jgi:AcrR family transcriptional regulator